MVRRRLWPPLRPPPEAVPVEIVCEDALVVAELLVMKDVVLLTELTTEAVSSSSVALACLANPEGECPPLALRHLLQVGFFPS